MTRKLRWLAALFALVPVVTWSNEAVDAAAERWWQALGAHDIDALVRHTAAGAMLIDAGETLATGHAQIRALVRKAPPVKFSTQVKDVDVSGDLAWRTVAVKRAGVTDVTYVLEIWKRVEGEWQLYRHASTGVLTSAMKPRRIPSQPVLDRTPSGTPTQ